MGGLAFLAGILMLTGAGASAMMDLGPHQKKKTWTGDYLDFSSLWVDDQQRIYNMVYKYGMPRTQSVGELEREGTLLPIGGFDIDRIEAEIGHEATVQLMKDWLVLELGFYPDHSSFDEALMQKYCWSGDYMSPLIPLALGLRRLYPHLSEDKGRIEVRDGSGSVRGILLGKQFAKDYISKLYPRHPREYEKLKDALNARYEVALMKYLSEEIIDLLDGIEMASYIRERPVEYVKCDYPSINLEHTQGRSLLDDFEPDMTVMEPKNVDNDFKRCNDYVDYLKEYIYQDGSVMLDEEKARAVFKNNHYLKWCEQKRDEALALAAQYEIEEHNLTKWDVCQITKGVPVGIDYTPIKRVLDTLALDFKEIRMDPTRFLSIPEWRYYRDNFSQSKIEQLERVHDQNIDEFYKRINEDNRFLTDFLTCAYVEDPWHVEAHNIEDPPKKPDLRRYSTWDDEWKRSQQSNYEEKMKIWKQDTKILNKAKASAMSCFNIKEEEDEFILKPKEVPNKSQN